MGRFRSADVSLGAVAVLANIALVSGVVLFTTGHTPDTPPAPTATTSRTTKTPTPSRTTTTATAPLAPAAMMASKRDVTLAVLGDETGDEPGEWVSVWARLLGQNRSVTLNSLDPQDPTQYAKAEKYGSGPRTAVIYNGSRRGAQADYAARRLPFLVPRRPDVVLLNYGRENTPGNVGGQLDTTLRAARAAWPGVAVVVVLQPPTRDDESAPVRSAIASWARLRSLQTIDVAAAFRAAGDPNSFVSVADPPSVNARGGQLWGEVVHRALGGTVPPPPPPTVSPVSPTAALQTQTLPPAPPAFTPPPRIFTPPPVFTPPPAFTPPPPPGTTPAPSSPPPSTPGTIPTPTTTTTPAPGSTTTTSLVAPPPVLPAATPTTALPPGLLHRGLWARGRG